MNKINLLVARSRQLQQRQRPPRVECNRLVERFIEDDGRGRSEDRIDLCEQALFDIAISDAEFRESDIAGNSLELASCRGETLRIFRPEAVENTGRQQLLRQTLLSLDKLAVGAAPRSNQHIDLADLGQVSKRFGDQPLAEKAGSASDEESAVGIVFVNHEG